jgi:hypothetical protein
VPEHLIVAPHATAGRLIPTGHKSLGELDLRHSFSVFHLAIGRFSHDIGQTCRQQLVYTPWSLASHRGIRELILDAPNSGHINRYGVCKAGSDLLVFIRCLRSDHQRYFWMFRMLAKVSSMEEPPDLTSKRID